MYLALVAAKKAEMLCFRIAGVMSASAYENSEHYYP